MIFFMILRKKNNFEMILSDTYAVLCYLRGTNYVKLNAYSIPKLFRIIDLPVLISFRVLFIVPEALLIISWVFLSLRGRFLV